MKTDQIEDLGLYSGCQGLPGVKYRGPGPPWAPLGPPGPPKAPRRPGKRFRTFPEKVVFGPDPDPDPPPGRPPEAG